MFSIWCLTMDSVKELMSGDGTDKVGIAVIRIGVLGGTPFSVVLKEQLNVIIFLVIVCHGSCCLLSLSLGRSDVKHVCLQVRLVLTHGGWVSFQEG